MSILRTIIIIFAVIAYWKHCSKKWKEQDAYIKNLEVLQNRPPKTMTRKYSEWEKKFLREGVFMPFGSLCNLYGQINQQKKKPIKTILKEATLLFELSQKMVKETIDGTIETEQKQDEEIANKVAKEMEEDASKEWDEKKQNLYNEGSKLDDLKADLPSDIKI